MDNQYTIDSHYRRVTPGRENKKANTYVILLGDSNVFGAGVDDNQTFSYYLGQMLPKQRIYNYSVQAVYPGELLERANLIAPNELSEKKGIALYVFNDHHIRRNMGAINEVGDWGADKPYYYEGPNGEIKADGSFAQQRPLWTFLMKQLFKSNILKYFHYEFQPTEKDWKFHTLILRHMREAVGKLNGQFIVVLCPDTQHSQHLIPYLEEAGISYINLSPWHMRNYVKGSLYLKNDLHYAPIGHQKFAEIIASVIQEKR
jgi:hypothetical protein